MPKRKMTYRVKSDAVQGEGSWVELGYMAWGDVQAAMSGDLKADDILEAHVKDWNWVDGEGEALPLDVGALFEPERVFLLDCLFDPNKDDSKN